MNTNTVYRDRHSDLWFSLPDGRWSYLGKDGLSAETYAELPTEYQPYSPITGAAAALREYAGLVRMMNVGDRVTGVWSVGVAGTVVRADVGTDGMVEVEWDYDPLLHGLDGVDSTPQTRTEYEQRADLMVL